MHARRQVVHTLGVLMQGPHLACTMWALASLRHAPSQQWVGAALMRTERCTRTLGSGAALASLLWGTAVLRCAPPGAWMEHYLVQVRARASVHVHGYVCANACLCMCVCARAGS